MTFNDVAFAFPSVENPVTTASVAVIVVTPTAISFSNLENSANLDAPVTVNAAPTVAAAPTFKSFVTVAPIDTVRSVAVND